jgi:hypothetical protein
LHDVTDVVIFAVSAIARVGVNEDLKLASADLDGYRREKKLSSDSFVRKRAHIFIRATLHTRMYMRFRD